MHDISIGELRASMLQIVPTLWSYICRTTFLSDQVLSNSAQGIVFHRLCNLSDNRYSAVTRRMLSAPTPTALT